MIQSEMNFGANFFLTTYAKNIVTQISFLTAISSAATVLEATSLELYLLSGPWKLITPEHC